MKLVTVFEKPELEKLQSAVVVERWDHILGTGTGKRKFKAEFNSKERELIEVYYKIFYRWYRQTGIPNNHKMSIQTYNLMKRACNFFGTY